jgi:hypothetical protein
MKKNEISEKRQKMVGRSRLKRADPSQYIHKGVKVGKHTSPQIGPKTTSGCQEWYAECMETCRSRPGTILSGTGPTVKLDGKTLREIRLHDVQSWGRRFAAQNV